MACLRIFMLCLPFLLHTAYASPISVANATLATKPGACSTEGAGSSGVCPNPEQDAEAKTIRTLEAYTALLEEKLQEHERQQREQQKNTVFVFLAIALSVGFVLIIALAACKVYVQSLQDQLRSVPAQQQQQQHQQEEEESEDEAGVPRCPKYISAGAAGRQHQRQLSGTLSSSSSNSGSKELHRSAFYEAIDGESSDEQELRLWPSREDVERAKAIEEARAAARPSAEVQQQQQQLESRCARLFDRLHEITDASRAFCSSSSSSESETEATALNGNGEASPSAPGDAAAGEAASGTQDRKKISRKKLGSSRKKQREANPARLEEQQKLLQQLQELFQEIDTKFNTNKPAHVAVMIRCCNALLRADGLAVLKACADCQPLHSAAQSIIETVVPCIWAT